jgi:hypothetical protein
MPIEKNTIPDSLSSEEKAFDSTETREALGELKEKREMAPIIVIAFKLLDYYLKEGKMSEEEVEDEKEALSAEAESAQEAVPVVAAPTASIEREGTEEKPPKEVGNMAEDEAGKQEPAHEKTTEKTPESLVSPDTHPKIADYLKTLPEANRIKVEKMPGNGNRETLMYVPPGTDPSKPVHLIYHFHGRGRGYQPYARRAGGGRNSFEQSLDATRALAAQGENVVLVYPLSSEQIDRPEKWQHKGWMKGSESLDTLHANTKDSLKRDFGIDQIGSVIVEGHSAGGQALMNIAESGSQVADEYLFLDASYSNWAEKCHQYSKKYNPKAHMKLVVKEGTLTDEGAKALEKVADVSIHRTSVNHGRMNQNFSGGLDIV